MPLLRPASALLLALALFLTLIAQNAHPAAAIEAPVLTTPAHESTVPSLGPTLRWTNPRGTTQYHIQVIPFNGDGPGFNLIRGVESSFTLPAPRFGHGDYMMLPGMTYEWRVRATDKTTSIGENDPAWGPWSTAFTFKTGTPSSATISPASPAHGTSVSTMTPVLRWADTNTEAFYYEVQVSKDQNFETAPDKAVASVYWNLVHGGITNPLNSYAIPASSPLEGGTTYFWRVRPRVQGDGTPVAWSQTFNFRTPRDFRFGVNGGFDRTNQVKDMGFGWLKLIVYWKDLEPTPGQYLFKERLDPTVDRILNSGLRLLVRVDETPDWASSRPGHKNAPPANDATLAEFMGRLADHLEGRVDAFEIWNEPNLNYEWGMIDPDPIRYGQMLKAIYPRIKAANPNAIVITGGLSTTGDGESGPYLGDLYYLAKLFDPNQDHDPSDGFGPYIDAIGTHPYGGPYLASASPQEAAAVGTYFRRAEEQHRIVEIWGKVDKPFWATEFGWFVNPAEEGLTCNVGDHFSKLVTTSDFQASQLAAAYQYALQNWPWMKAMFLFNFDAAGDPWRDNCDQVRFFSIMKGNGSFRPAFNALKAMPK